MRTYYIYEVKGVKIGCTVDPYTRIMIGQKFKEYTILEEHTDIYEASKREIELQKQYGYPVDCVPYYVTMKTQKIASSPEVRAKAGKSISIACKGGKKPNVSRKKKGVYMPWLFTDEVNRKRVLNTDQKNKMKNVDMKAKSAHRQRPVIATHKDGKEYYFSGIHEAARQLTKVVKGKVYAEYICTILNPNYPHCKTTKGYAFKYAQ